MNSEASQQNNKVDLVIPMIPSMEIAVANVAEVVAQRMAFDEEQCGDVKMALIEACINAFEHSRSTDGQVFIKFFMEPEQMRVVIADHGQGFDRQAVPVPEIKAKMGSAHKRGWGLMLIENLMDSVEIVSNDQGTTLTMTKRK